MVRKVGRILFAALFLVCIIMAAKQLFSYKRDSDYYTGLSQSIEMQEKTEKSKDSSDYKDSLNSRKKEKADEATLKVNFKKLQEINMEVQAWLYIPGTKVSYPVVRGKDNSYYLTHLFDKSQGSAGCLFMDCENHGFQDEHIVIYGHHMKDGSMLASLNNYQNQEYYEKHKKAFLLTKDKVYTIVFFSGHRASADSDAWKLRFSDKKEYDEWIKKEQKSSLFQMDEKQLQNKHDDIQNLKQKDKQNSVITFSTCDYTFHDARFVLHGYLIGMKR